MNASDRLQLDIEDAYLSMYNLTPPLKDDVKLSSRARGDIKMMEEVQSYLKELKESGTKQMDSSNYRELNFMVNSYIEKIGSQKFSSHLLNVFNEKLELDSNPDF
jgi:hypothetical protein